MLLGDVPLAEGERLVGRRTVIGAIGQERAGYAGEAALVDELMARTGLVRGDARTLLAKFGLRPGSHRPSVLVALARESGRALTSPSCRRAASTC